MNNTINREAMKAENGAQLEAGVPLGVDAVDAGLSPEERRKAWKREYKRSWAAANQDLVRASLERRKETILEQKRARYRQNPEKVNAANNRWKAKNKEKVREYKRKWARAHSEEARAYRDENKERRLEQKRNYAKQQRAKESRRAADWKKSNRERHLEMTRKREAKEREELRESYVRRLLKDGTALKSADIPPELVELKKKHLTIHRKLNQTKP